MSTLTLPKTAISHRPESVYDLVEPLFELAEDSSSLLASRHGIYLAGQELEVPRFLLLGKRGGGIPIRVAILAGLDGGRLETTLAVVRLLFQIKLDPTLARDFALFVYPILDVGAFGSPQNAPAPFRERFQAERSDEDVQYFRAEFRKWAFNGVIELQTGVESGGFAGTTSSQVIGAEVVAPALRAISPQLEVSNGGAPAINPAALPWLRTELARPASNGPFALSLSAPRGLTVEHSATGLFLLLQNTLRNYRQVVAHAANL